MNAGAPVIILIFIMLLNREDDLHRSSGSNIHT